MKDYWLHIILMICGIGVAIASFILAINKAKKDQEMLDNSYANLELNRLIDSLNRVNNRLNENIELTGKINQNFLKTNNELIENLDELQKVIKKNTDEIKAPIPSELKLNIKVFANLEDSIGDSINKDADRLNIEKDGGFLQLPTGFMEDEKFKPISDILNDAFSEVQINYTLIKNQEFYEEGVRTGLILNPKHYWNVVDGKTKGNIRYNYLEKRVYLSIWNYPLKIPRTEEIGGKYGLHDAILRWRFNFGKLGFENNRYIKSSFVPEEEMNIFTNNFLIGKIVDVSNKGNHTIEGLIKIE